MRQEVKNNNNNNKLTISQDHIKYIYSIIICLIVPLYFVSGLEEAKKMSH